jgi:GNAT superfamily N-acetyltransferase
VILVRAALQDDLGVITEITQLAYSSTALNKAGISRNFQIQPDGFLLACLDNQAVGVVCVFDYTHFASVGMLGVLPQARGHGVGRKLMQHVETWATARAIPSLVLDATPEGAKLYETMNYIDIDINYKMVPNSSSGKFTTSENIRIATIDDLPELLEFDISIFGANRKKVLEVFLTDFSNRAFLSFDKQKNINGFILAQNATIGPWIATSVQVAEDLLQAALNLPFDSVPRVLLPGANTQGLELLKRYGFKDSRVVRHMVKGPIPKRARKAIYSQVSYSLG